MKIIYAQSTMYRKPQYSVSTQIAEADGKMFVLKKALTKEAIPFVNCLEKNYQEMARQYGEEHVAKGELLSPGVFKMEYVDGETLAINSMRYFEAGDFEGFIQNIAYYYQHILASFEDKDVISNDFNPLLPNRKYNIDINFNNIILTSKYKFKIIDYEWLLPSISRQHVFFRTLALLHKQNRKAFHDKNMTLEMFISGSGIDKKNIDYYIEAEKIFYGKVLDWSSKKNEKNTFNVNL